MGPRAKPASLRAVRNAVVGLEGPAFEVNWNAIRLQICFAGEERSIWVQYGDGQISEVRCRPDISVDTLKTLIKERFKRALEQWDPADLTLKFNGTILKAHQTISVIPDDKDETGEPIPVTVHAQ